MLSRLHKIYLFSRSRDEEISLIPLEQFYKEASDDVLKVVLNLTVFNKLLCIMGWPYKIL